MATGSKSALNPVRPLANSGNARAPNWFPKSGEGGSFARRPLNPKKRRPAPSPNSEMPDAPILFRAAPFR